MTLSEELREAIRGGPGDVTPGLLERAADALDGMTWQPIETAPKDGTEILVFRQYEYGQTILPHYEVVRWEGEWLYAGEYSIAATHWTPLPPPPKD